MKYNGCMNQVLSVSCKLNPNSLQQQKLAQTLRAFAEACNWVNQNTPQKIVNAVKLQNQVYYEIRARFGLGANLAQQVCRRVAGNRKTAQHGTSFKRGNPANGVPQKDRPVKQFKGTSATYDQRIFSFFEKDWTVSLWLLGGRERIPLAIGNYQRGLLKGANPTGTTLVQRRDGSFHLQICLEQESPEPIVTDQVIGVDLGRTDIAHTSNGDNWSGKQITQIRDHFAKMRAILQRKASKGTRSTRRRCRQLQQRLTGREKRFQSWLNHCISRTLIDNAKAHGQSIAIEDLTGIRHRTNQQPRNKTERRRSNNWAFHQLRQYLTYKALAAGVRIVLVPPAYTSETCHQCLHMHPDPDKSYRSGKRLKCGHCSWHGDADFNGAMNLKALGQTYLTLPVKGPWLSCSLSEVAGGLLKPRALSAA